MWEGPEEQWQWEGPEERREWGTPEAQWQRGIPPLPPPGSALLAGHQVGCLLPGSADQHHVRALKHLHFRKSLRGEGGARS